MRSIQTLLTAFATFAVLAGGTTAPSAAQEAEVSMPGATMPPSSQSSRSVAAVFDSVLAASGGIPVVEVAPDPVAMNQLSQSVEEPPAIGTALDVAQLSTRGALPVFAASSAARGGGTLLSLRIKSAGAVGLRIGLLVDRIPKGAKVLFASTDENAPPIPEVTGKEIAATVRRNLASGDSSPDARTYWSPTIAGEESIVSFYLPPGVPAERLKVTIPQISYLFRESIDAMSALCNLDVTCYSSWSSQARAVAWMIYTVSGSTYICTGTLLNDSDPATYTPYFITANHCISSQTVASSLQTDWFYQSASCNSSTMDSRRQSIFGGAQLLYNSISNDISFLRLNTTPPGGVYFAGWSTANSVGQAGTGISHPAGDRKKINFGSVSSYWNCYPSSSGQFSCTGASSSTADHLKLLISSGAVEGGSSGSGLFNSNSQLIGTLHGGSPACSSQESYYGIFGVAYRNSLSQWLGSGSSGQAPIVTTSSATSVGTSSATLNGSVNPNGLATSAYFQWGTTTSYGNTTASQSLGSGTSSLPLLAGLTGLSAGTTYHFRAVASSTGGTTYGTDMTFTPSTPCSTGTINAGQTINGSLASSDCRSVRGTGYYADRFSFSATAGQQVALQLTATFDAYLSLIGPSGSVVTSNDDGGGGTNSRIPATSGYFTLPTTGTYVVEASSYATGATGTYSLTRTGGGSPPSATTNAASAGTTSATLNGSINPNGLATTAYFQWGATTGYGNTTASQSMGSGTSSTPLSASLTGLSAGATYHFRAVASSSAGTTYGADVTFTTGGSCSTGAISPGQTINGSLASSDCRSVRGTGYYADRFSFSGTTGQQVALQLTATFDAYLNLIGPNGAVVTSNDDGGGGTNSRIPATSGYFTLPSSGTYVIEATSYGTGATGTYSLSLTSSGGGCTTGSISAGQTINGSLASTDCRSVRGTGYYADRFTFSGTTGQQIALQLTAGFDAYLNLVGPNGAVVSYNDDGGGGTNSRIPATSGYFTLPSSGTYIVEATSYSTGATGTYSVSLTVASSGCTTGSISSGQSIGGSLASTDCRSVPRGTTYYADRYTFSGTAGQQIALQLTAGFDAYLYLIGPNGSVVTFNDDGGGGTNSRIPATSGYFTLPSTGTYVVEATSYSAGTAGSYTLTRY